MLNPSQLYKHGKKWIDKREKQKSLWNWLGDENVLLNFFPSKCLLTTKDVKHNEHKPTHLLYCGHTKRKENLRNRNQYFK